MWKDVSVIWLVLLLYNSNNNMSQEQLGGGVKPKVDKAVGSEIDPSDSSKVSPRPIENDGKLSFKKARRPLASPLAEGNLTISHLVSAHANIADSGRPPVRVAVKKLVNETGDVAPSFENDRFNITTHRLNETLVNDRFNISTARLSETMSSQVHNTTRLRVKPRKKKKLYGTIAANNPALPKFPGGPLPPQRPLPPPTSVVGLSPAVQTITPEEVETTQLSTNVLPLPSYQPPPNSAYIASENELRTHRQGRYYGGYDTYPGYYENSGAMSGLYGAFRNVIQSDAKAASRHRCCRTSR